MARASKPTWLRSWLSKLNWTILAWNVYVGDAIESGIDWSIDIVNNALEWADSAYSRAVAAWNKAVDIGSTLLTTISRELQPLWDTVNAWRDRLSEWWTATKTSVLEWVDTARDYASDLFRQASKSINNIKAWLDNFKSAILPTLPNRSQVSDMVEADVKPVRDTVNQHSNWLDLVKDFFTDPPQFLFNMIIKMLERFW